MFSPTRRALEVCLVALSIIVPCRLASADAIMLSWDSSTDSFTVGYKVYVGTQSGTYTQKYDAGAATSFTLTTAVAGQRYCFALTAYSSSLLESAKSNEVCGFSNAPPTLTNPGNQTSTVGQSTAVQLAGSDPEGEPLTFSATGLPPGLSLMASTGYISGTGTTAGNYTVAVKAFDGVVSSATQSFTWAMSGATTPPPTSPSSAVTLSAQKIDRSTRDQVQLTWTTASWSQAWVYRNGTRISETANDGAFTDNIRRASGAYTYRVCAPDASTCSNDVTVTF